MLSTFSRSVPSKVYEAWKTIHGQRKILSMLLSATITNDLRWNTMLTIFALRLTGPLVYILNQNKNLRVSILLHP